MLSEYVSQGKTIREIAKLIGKSPTSVRYQLKKLGLKTLNSVGPKKSNYSCNYCGEDNPDEFYGRQKSCCKKCQYIRYPSKRKEYKQQMVDYLGGKCSRCGYNKSLSALEFHHTDPSTKDPEYSKMRNWSFERKKIELDKCELVCANCHREIHEWLENL